MELGKIIKWIEEKAPLHLQESYDNSGLTIGSCERDINGVVVCLDADEATIGYAREKSAGLVISHHPCVFRSLKVFKPGTMEGSVLFKAIAHNIAVYSAHTNFDSARGGLGDLLCSELGLENVSVIKPHDASDPGQGIGRVGSFAAPVSYDSFIKILRNRLGAEAIRDVGKRPESIRKVAVLNGSYDRDYLEDIMNAGVDVLLTGDLKYHDALELRYFGVYALDAGHYRTEIIFVRAFAQLLREAFPSLAVYTFEGRDVFNLVPAP